jgi:hypothetical protein
MNNWKKYQAVKSFSMTNMLLGADLDQIEREYSIDLGRKAKIEKSIENSYYPQFDQALREEAESMAAHYQLFYCLEKSIRALMADVFEASGENNWWDKLVPEQVKINVKKSIKREKEAAVTPRSHSPLDYTTFGELGEIIKANWSLFGGSVFNDAKAMEKVLANLNSLRNPIAHCSPLAEDEVLRLELSFRDWFRIME